MIRMRCTFVEADTCVEHDLDVCAPAGSVVADLRGALPPSVPALPRTWTIEGEVLGEDAPLGRPPLVHGCLIVVWPADHASAGGQGGHDHRGSTPLRLAVVAGPDAGRAFALPPGSHVVGRAAPADLVLNDPGISRRHLELLVDPTGVRVRDLGSINGTTVDGARLQPNETPPGAVTRRGIPIRPGQRLGMGASAVTLRVGQPRPASINITGTGLIEVNRAPCPDVEPAVLRLTAPARPAERPRTRPPLIAMFAPLLIALPMAWLMRQPTYLLLGLTGPLMAFATVVGDRSSRRRDRRVQDSRWRDLRATMERRMARALTDELTRLRLAYDDPESLLTEVRVPGRRLWERDLNSPGLLVMSLGTGTVAARSVAFDSPAGESPRIPPLDGAPVTVDLRRHGHLGICGHRATAVSLTRWLIGQIAARHSPRHVSVVVLHDAAHEVPMWEWIRWLPQSRTTGAVTEAAATLERVLRQRQEHHPTGRPWDGPRLVVLVDGAPTLHALPGLAAVLAEGPEVGIHAICLSANPTGLPATCGAIAETRADGTITLTPDGPTEGFLADGTGSPWAWQLARALAPLRDATPEPGRLPTEVRLLDLLEVDATDPNLLANAWTRCPRTTRARLGVGLDGPVDVDLVQDGPHALVAGTTGAGKSELLRTLVASLAVGNRPDELTFVLIDYKGGAAFRGCADLPHTTGLVTDLDDHLAARALDSLSAELTRREQVLNEAGCQDLAEYQELRDRTSGPPLAAMPRLVIVIDEFRALATELPQFLDGLVHIAAVGRSLGVHLVLATQRPAGVVTSDIKANVNLRIALRVRDRSDSEDVLDAPDAALLGTDTPGRALARLGPTPVVALQVARVAGSAATDVDRVTVRAVDRGPTTGSTHDGPTAGGGDTPGGAGGSDDLSHIVSSCRAATLVAGIAVPAPVWHPPLPASLPLDRGDQLRVIAHGSAPLGLHDLPRQQRQDGWRWHPVDDSHLAICGAPRSGRSTALTTLVVGLARAWSPRELHLHVVDATGGPLRDAALLPHTGTVLGTDPPALVARLVRRLHDEVQRRRSSSAHGADSGDPVVVLVIDGWEALSTALESIDHGRALDDLVTLLRDGESTGFRALVAGGRGVLLSRIGSVVGRRLLLRPNDPTDLMLAGLPSSVAVPQTPGRAVATPDGTEIQVAVPPPLSKVAEAIHDQWPGVAHVPPLVRDLPDDLRWDALDNPHGPRLPATAPPHDSGTSRSVVLGVGGDDASPIGLDLRQNRLALIAGPPGSGRSTALHTLARALHARGVPVIAVCPRPSSLSDGPWHRLTWNGGDPDDERAQALTDLLAITPDACLLVDDADLLLDHPVDGLLAAVARGTTGTTTDAAVVVAGTTSTLLRTFRGSVCTIRTARTGLLLNPAGAADGELFGIRTSAASRSLPGRGLLVVRGAASAIQVAR